MGIDASELRHEQAAAALIAVHDGAARIACLTEDCRPRDVDEAYAIQRRIGDRLGEVAGWKVGPSRASGGLVHAPLYRAQVHRSEARVVLPPHDGMIVEIEIGLEIVGPVAGGGYSGSDPAVRVVPIIELLGSRYSDMFKVSPLENLADANGCAAVIVGRAAADGVGSWSATEAELTVDGERICRIDYGSALARARGMLAELALDLPRHGRSLEPGAIIICGSMIPPARAGRRMVADFGGLGTVIVELTEDA